MNTVSQTLTVMFDDPFWIGVIECWMDGKLSVCKIPFGKEPSEQEVYDKLEGCYHHVCFSFHLDADIALVKKNPKRRQREAKRQIKASGISTKSQLALKQQQEQKTLAKKAAYHEMSEAQKRQKFLLKQQKKKAKHRGR